MKSNEIAKILRKLLWKLKKKYGKAMCMIGSEVGETIENIKDKQLELLNKKTPIIYMVFDEKLNMYVGQTLNMTDRFYRHENLYSALP